MSEKETIIIPERFCGSMAMPKCSIEAEFKLTNVSVSKGDCRTDYEEKEQEKRI